MATYFGKSCSFGLLRVPFVNCRQIMDLVIFPFGFEGRMWDLIVSVPDHCLSFYFTFIPIGKRALFTVVTDECLFQVQICKQKVLIMIVCLWHKNKFWHVNATVGGSGVICTREQKQKTTTKKTKKKTDKKYTRVQIVHFYRLLQVDVISKRENSLGYTGRQVNSLTGLSIVIFFA